MPAQKSTVRALAAHTQEVTCQHASTMREKIADVLLEKTPLVNREQALIAADALLEHLRATLPAASDEGQRIERLAYALHGVVVALNHSIPAGPAELDRKKLSELHGLADAALLLSSDLSDVVGEPGALP